MILGVDPGQSGGLVCLNDQGIVWAETMPENDGVLDLGRIASLITAWEIKIAFVEKVHSMPKQGVSSSFKFGDSFGSIKGILAGLSIPFELVTPQRWMKVMHVGVEGVDTKAKSQIAASRLFPTFSFLASERSKKPHEGMVEAALIAEFGRRSRSTK